MPQGILGKSSRTVAKPVADQIIVDDLLEKLLEAEFVLQLYARIRCWPV